MKKFSLFRKIGFLSALIATGVFISCTEDDTPVGDEPVASFQFEISSSNFLEVAFSNFSQNADSYEWNFGDNNTSTEESPTHTYAETGTYTVSLTATGADGVTNTQERDITIADPDATLTLLAGVDSKEWILLREEIALGIGPAPGDVQWWSFGGVTPLGARPCILDDTYTFHRNGTFVNNTQGTFFLDAQANGGWNDDINGGEGCTDETTAGAFTTSSGGDYSAFANGGDYTYDFASETNMLTLMGAGAYIGLPNKTNAGDLGPDGTPPASTIFSVNKLVEGTTADSLQISIQVNGEEVYWTYWLVSYANAGDVPAIPTLDPNADFTTEADGLTVTFNNTSNSAAVNFSWDFGDNNMSTEESPVHTYAAEGTYSVTLDTDDGNGNTATITKDVVVAATIPTPTEKFNTFKSTDAADVVGLTYNANSTSIVTPGVEDPAGGTDLVGSFQRSTSQFADAQFDFGSDESLENFNTISMDVYFPSSNDYSGTLNEQVHFYLANRDFGNFWEEWEAHIVDVDQPNDEWVTITVTMTDGAQTRTNLDFLLIKIGGDNHTADGTFYVRNLEFSMVE